MMTFCSQRCILISLWLHATLTQPLTGKCNRFGVQFAQIVLLLFLPPLAFMFLQKMARMTQEFPAMVRRAMALERENWVDDGGGGEGIYDALFHLQILCDPLRNVTRYNPNNPTICEE